MNGPPASEGPPSPDANGRDQNGRFAKGNPGGPGNPFARRTAALRQAFSDALTQEGLNILAQRLLLQAQNGDVAAAKLVLAYAIGKPVDPVDPDTLDHQEFQLFKQLPTPPQDVHRILNTLPAGLACELIRILLPNTEHQIKGLWRKKMQRDMKKEERREMRRAAAANGVTTFSRDAQSSERSATPPMFNRDAQSSERSATPRPSPNDPNGVTTFSRDAQSSERSATPRPSPNDPIGKTPVRCVKSSQTHPTQDPPSLNPPYHGDIGAP